ncbi:hypothetical protein Hanom_Chr17g01561111 [Helianthus anomalus]
MWVKIPATTSSPTTLISTSTTTHSHSSSSLNKKETLDSSVHRRGRYKFGILSAIVPLAFWSIFTLHLSVANPALLLFTTISTSLFEIEERKKVVKQMWDVYTNSRMNKLPSKTYFMLFI